MPKFRVDVPVVAVVEACDRLEAIAMALDTIYPGRGWEDCYQPPAERPVLSLGPEVRVFEIPKGQRP